MNEKVIICPYCKNTAEIGVITSPRELAWARKKHFFGASELHNDSVRLSEFNVFRGSAVTAFLCRKCEKIIIDYSDGECDYNKRSRE